MDNRPLRKKLNDIVFTIARCTELLLSVIIMLVIMLLIVNLVSGLVQTSIFQMKAEEFNTFLSSALSLVVGIEFVKMLCKHTSSTLVEVLMFATARQMVVEHLNPFQTLVGILAIAILFAIRKFLFLKTEDSEKLDDRF